MFCAWDLFSSKPKQNCRLWILFLTSTKWFVYMLCRKSRVSEGIWRTGTGVSRWSSRHKVQHGMVTEVIQEQKRPLIDQEWCRGLWCGEALIAHVLHPLSFSLCVLISACACTREAAALFYGLQQDLGLPPLTKHPWSGRCKAKLSLDGISQCEMPLESSQFDGKNCSGGEDVGFFLPILDSHPNSSHSPLFGWKREKEMCVLCGGGNISRKRTFNLEKWFLFQCHWWN